MRYTDPSGHLSMANRYDIGGTTGDVVVSCPSGSTSCQVNPDLTTGTTCTGGACAITTTSTDDGYTGQLSTSTGSKTSSAGVTTIGMATSTLDTRPGGVMEVTVSQSTTTIPTIGQPTITTYSPRTNTYTTLGTEISNLEASTHYEPQAAGALLILVGSVMFATAAVVFPNPYSATELAIFGGGAAATFEYLNGNPEPTISGAVGAWETGAYQSLLCHSVGTEC